MVRQKSATNYKPKYLRKGKKEEIGNTVNNNNPHAGERGGGGKESRSDRVDDEGEKEELLGKIPRYTYLTLTPPYNLIG